MERVHYFRTLQGFRFNEGIYERRNDSGLPRYHTEQFIIGQAFLLVSLKSLACSKASCCQLISGKPIKDQWRAPRPGNDLIHLP